MSMEIRIATRASKLALAQTEIVRNSILAIKPDVNISIITITTKGDKNRSDFLYGSSSVGYFTSEVEKALLDGRADLAVHSLKDLPTAITKGLIIAAIPKRESVADALIAGESVKSIEDIPAGTTVGTSSLRRIAQLQGLRDDIKCVPLRGNIETRIAKVDTGVVDAAIIACAGLSRLGLTSRISAILDPDKFPTAPGQGALAIQIRDDNAKLAEIVSNLDDKQTRIAVESERELLAALHGGCSIPLGVHTRIDDDKITIDATVSDLNGGKPIHCNLTTDISDAIQCAKDLADQLIEAGAEEILKQIKDGPGKSKD